MHSRFLLTILLLLPITHTAWTEGGGKLERIKYNHPGLVADLGVGLWAEPLPMDYDGDGDMDLVVACAGLPYKGVYLFENASGKTKLPVFKPAKRLDTASKNMTVSYVNGKCVVLTPENEYPDFTHSALANPRPIPYKETFHSQRADQWKYCDYNGDGITDLIIGADDWREYGWDNAFNEKGEWTHGPLRGHVYVMRNAGTDDKPQYEQAAQIAAGEKPIDVFGTPSPNFVDADGDGDLDLFCGEFLDRIAYFENLGTRKEPQYAPGRFIAHEGREIHMELEMLQVVAVDWDADGDPDLIVGQEDGRVALLENTGRIVDGMPDFLAPVFFQQEADDLKVGALCTPYSVDWDDDGDEDLIVGDTAGYLNFVENLGGGPTPQWALPVRLTADGEIIRIQAGPNGSIQGPCEAKWGYTVPTVADWDQDGHPDILINNIWGKVLWYRNVGEKGKPRLEAARPVEVEWNGPAPKPAWLWWTPQGKDLVTQWRTRPMVIDWSKDGLNDLVMLDQEGYLAFFQREKKGDSLLLLPPQRIFTDDNGEPLHLNPNQAGKSGRRQFIMTDWDGDGKIDILLDGINMDFLQNVSTPEHPNAFKNLGPVDKHKLAGHTPCPAVVDWDKNGIPDLLIGAEDGFLYYLRHPNAK